MLVGFAVPVTTGKITSVFGIRKDPVTGEDGVMHNGIDIAAPLDTPVMSAKPGVVEASNENSDTGGKLIFIRHEDGTQSRYLHLNRIILGKPGTKVYARTVIGLMGKTGQSTGVHLHFEVRDKNGTPIDPGPLWGLTPYSAKENTDVSNIALPLALLVGLVVFTLLMVGGRSASPALA